MSDAKATRTVTVNNERGIHVRVALLIAQAVRRYDAKIVIIKDVERVEGTNVLHMLSLGTQRGESLTLEAAGPQAEQAVAELADLIENHLDEEDQTTGKSS